MAEPLVIPKGDALEVRCPAPGCGRKLMGTIAPGFKIASGWAQYQCNRCKGVYRITSESKIAA